MPTSPSRAALSAAATPAAAKTQQNSSTATRRISLLAVPLLAVLASRLRRETGPRVFTKAELAQYVDTSRGLKVAICGQVFDVSTGAEFYAKGAGYGFFAGRDASLAFATGNFKTNLTDNVGAPASPPFRSPRRRGEVDARTSTALSCASGGPHLCVPSRGERLHRTPSGRRRLDGVEKAP